MTESIQPFIDKWVASGSAERANKDPFLIDLCDALEVPRPAPSTGDNNKDSYVFEKDALMAHPGGAVTLGKMDLFKAGCFVLEAKQGSEPGAKKVGSAKRETPAWNVAMKNAYGQALSYARTVEKPVPFIIACDKRWAKEIAELVLWIGYLQWHFRIYGKRQPVPEPVLRDYKNIECRDAVLAYDSEELVRDENGKPVTRWDGETMKKSPTHPQPRRIARRPSQSPPSRAP